MTDDTDLRISQSELATNLAGPNAPTVIDVRDADEYATRHIPAAKNVPLTEIAPLLDDPDVADPIVFVCESGLRSMQAAQFARIAGLTNVHSLDGGMAAWQPVESSD